jgi:hypothetical protein
MIYILLILSIIICIVINNIYKRRKSQIKKAAEVAGQWGKPLDSYRNFKLIGAYLNANISDNRLADATAADLDVDALFAYLDRTQSKPGQQYLYSKLYTPELDQQKLVQLERNIARFNLSPDELNAISVKLSDLNHTDAWYLPDLFIRKHQSLFGPLATFYIKTMPYLLVIVTTLAIAFHNQFYFLIMVAMILGNTAMHYLNKNKILSYMHSLPQLLLLYKVAAWLENKGYLFKRELAKESLKQLTKLKKALLIVGIQSKTAGDPTDLTFLVTEWIKILFLTEPRNFINTITLANQHQADIKNIFEAVAETDMIISIRSLRQGLPYFCVPGISNGDGQLVANGVYHPLVTDCVPNSIAASIDQGVLITGSNMSGKTTFIRAMAINSLLAQTLNTCCAKQYLAPPLRLFTSINRSDDLDGKKSYFQAEAIAILDIVNLCKQPGEASALVIIDEIFRGTNTIERVAAAKAVLSYLIKSRTFVFVSTHDLELAGLLGEEYAIYSFEETMGANRLQFDYTIKKGLLKNKNGIAVLQGLGYPDAIVNDAYLVSKQLRDKYN